MSLNKCSGCVSLCDDCATESMETDGPDFEDGPEFAGWEERSVKGAPVQGKKFDKDKVRMDLLPVEALDGMAKILTFGASKYGDRNWENGINYSRVYGAALRHMTAWWKGEDNDPETGESHLHHAACCLAFLQTFTTRKMEKFDDRPIPKEDTKITMFVANDNLLDSLFFRYNRPSIGVSDPNGVRLKDL